MTHITYAPVDRQFRTLERDLPAGAPFNGVDPMEGVSFGFSRSSRYPLPAGEPDVRFGTVEGEVENDPAILLQVISAEEYEAAEAVEMGARQPTSDAVNVESDRRIASGFVWDGCPFDNDLKANRRITGAASLAGFAMGAGAGPGNLLWHGGTEPFTWILRDNSTVQLDAPSMFAVGQAAAAWEQAHVFAARALKGMTPIPADYAADQHWPAAG